MSFEAKPTIVVGELQQQGMSRKDQTNAPKTLSALRELETKFNNVVEKDRFTREAEEEIAKLSPTGKIRTNADMVESETVEEHEKHAQLIKESREASARLFTITQDFTPLDDETELTNNTTNSESKNKEDEDEVVENVPLYVQSRIDAYVARGETPNSALLQQWFSEAQNPAKQKKQPIKKQTPIPIVDKSGKTSLKASNVNGSATVAALKKATETPDQHYANTEDAKKVGKRMEKMPKVEGVPIDLFGDSKKKTRTNGLSKVPDPSTLVTRSHKSQVPTRSSTTASVATTTKAVLPTKEVKKDNTMLPPPPPPGMPAGAMVFDPSLAKTSLAARKEKEAASVSESFEPKTHTPVLNELSDNLIGYGNLLRQLDEIRKQGIDLERRLHMDNGGFFQKFLKDLPSTTSFYSSSQTDGNEVAPPLHKRKVERSLLNPNYHRGAWKDDSPEEKLEYARRRMQASSSFGPEDNWDESMFSNPPPRSYRGTRSYDSPQVAPYYSYPHPPPPPPPAVYFDSYHSGYQHPHRFYHAF